MSRSSSDPGPMRFGLVGTGPWASTVHGPALATTDGVELVGVWGRSAPKAAALAEQLDVRAFDGLRPMLETVDAVAFAVSPEVQAELATTAARAGKHLLLDKPVATSAEQARALARTAQERGVASVVFFTDRFSGVGAGWLAQVNDRGGWRGGDVRCIASLDAPGNPFGDSAWRRERGALWDIGPHALSTLIAALGPVSRVSGVAGAADLVHLVLQHESGVTSTATLTLFGPEPAATRETWLWGDHGTAVMPSGDPEGPVAALGRAAAALKDSASTGAGHEADLRLGVRVVELLEDVERQLDGR
jgi:predicted dehydrogenase